jgi:hypothetical protein
MVCFGAQFDGVWTILLSPRRTKTKRLRDRAPLGAPGVPAASEHQRVIA